MDKINLEKQKETPMFELYVHGIQLWDTKGTISLELDWTDIFLNEHITNNPVYPSLIIIIIPDMNSS